MTPGAGVVSASSICLVLLSGGARASADPGGGPPARLSYLRESGAQSCPDEQRVRDAVGARLGYDPFRAEASRELVARVSRDETGWVARISLRDVAGASLGERVIRSRAERCEELTEAMVLAISLAMDPIRASGHALPPSIATPPPPLPASPAPPDAVSPPRAPAAPPDAVSAPRAPVAPAAQVQLQAGLSASIGLQVKPAFGLSVGAGARWARLSLSGEGRVELPASAPVRQGRISTSLLWLAFTPCLHSNWLAGCAVIGAGGFRTSGEGWPDARQTTLPQGLVGARLKAAFPFTERVSFHPYLEVLAPLVRATLSAGGIPVWSSPAIAGTAGLSISTEL